MGKAPPFVSNLLLYSDYFKDKDTNLDDVDQAKRAMCRLRQDFVQYVRQFKQNTGGNPGETRDRLVTRLQQYFTLNNHENDPVKWQVVQKHVFTNVASECSRGLNDMGLEDIIDSDLLPDKILWQDTSKSPGGFKFACIERSSVLKMKPTIRTLLTSISTDAFVNSIFDTAGRDPDKVMRDYLVTFYKIASVKLQEYCERQNLSYPNDVVLWYKGGNIFRMYFEGFFDNFLPGSYKKSDIDFEIFLRPKNLTDPNDRMWTFHIQNIHKIIALSLIEFRKYIMLNRNTMTNKMTNMETDTQLKSRYVHEMRKIKNNVTGVDIKLLPRSDMFITTHQDNNYFTTPAACSTGRDTVVICPSDMLLNVPMSQADDSPFYITVNNSIQFNKEGNLVTHHFDLLRMKMNILLTFDNLCVQAPSEVIDVSIPRFDDTKSESRKKAPKLDWLTSIHLEDRNLEKTQVYIPTLQYLILKDLYVILFVEAKPWEDVKYIKRLRRFLLGAVMLRYATTVCSDNATTRGTSISLSNYIDGYITRLKNVDLNVRIPLNTEHGNIDDPLDVLLAITPDATGQRPWLAFRETTFTELVTIKDYVVQNDANLQQKANRCKASWFSHV